MYGMSCKNHLFLLFVVFNSYLYEVHNKKQVIIHLFCCLYSYELKTSVLLLVLDYDTCPGDNVSICLKDTEQVKRLCQSGTER